jgi:hypothetical protein
MRTLLWLCLTAALLVTCLGSASSEPLTFMRWGMGWSPDSDEPNWR